MRPIRIVVFSCAGVPLSAEILQYITRDANSAASTEFVRDGWPDVMLMATFHQILRRPMVEIPALAFLNVHCSLLPEYRGPDPIGTALRAGVPYTGVTVHRVDEGVDSGEILAQERIAVGDARTEAQLRPLLSAVAARLVLDCLDRVRSGRLHGGGAG